MTTAVPPARALVQRYVSALHDRRYRDAFAMLDTSERAYFRTAANYASGFAADGYRLQEWTIAGTRASGATRIVFVRERITLADPVRDARAAAVVTVPYGVEGTGAAARILDPGRPWRAYAVAASNASDAVRVSVKKIALYARTISVVVTIANLGDRFITVLPYGRSVLRDDAGAIYRPLETNDWRMTDRQFFLGVRLAPNTRYTGAIAFVTPPLDDRARRFALTLGPSVRDGADAPVSVDVPGLVPRP